MAVGHAYLPRGLAATVELLAVVLNRCGGLGLQNETTGGGESVDMAEDG